jgi:diketogulonate reductase-like aldo/keto reductase
MQIPRIIYGTAWKKDQTSDLVFQAISAGFRGIDTAAQPKHYNEKGVGDALLKLESQGISRRDLFLQTKFTPISGQDPERIPYDPNATLSVQVAQSFSSSQANLRTDYVDSLVLHSPLRRWDQMLEVWSAMENLYHQGSAKVLGISNCYELDVFQTLYDRVSVKPKILQNRFYLETAYDLDLRNWCNEKGVIYQSFWTLTANPHILNDPRFLQIAKTHGKTEAQIFFRFVSQIGIVPLTGTRSPDHMKEDLDIFQFELTQSDIDLIGSMLLPD